MRILLIEDDDSIREVFKLILESENLMPHIEIVTAANGSEAFDSASNLTPNLILLDMTLAGEDGIDVYKRLRTIDSCRTVPVVAVTAHNLRELESMALAMGFAGYVTKPIDFERVLFPLIIRLLQSQIDSKQNQAA